MGDVGGVEGADAVGEAIRHAMRVFTGNAVIHRQMMRSWTKKGCESVHETALERLIKLRAFVEVETDEGVDGFIVHEHFRKTRETSHRERFRGFRRRHGERKRRNEEEQQQEERNEPYSM